jgi:MFS family permease
VPTRLFHDEIQPRGSSSDRRAIYTSDFPVSKEERLILMSLQRVSLQGIVVAMIVFSIYLGIQIDYRHWTWIIFLILLPVALATLLAIQVRRSARQQRGAQEEAK